MQFTLTLLMLGETVTTCGSNRLARNAVTAAEKSVELFRALHQDLPPVEALSTGRPNQLHSYSRSNNTNHYNIFNI